jgi:S-adenosylmethionine-diacylglycerol 3-amino-3-carboxypropyl transferase
MRDGPLSISKRALSRAVHRNKAATTAGMLERCFTFAFKSLVYPQIWEDPAVDMAALALGPGSRIVTIASGGCNVLAYLTADPAQITAVDLNRAHIALTRIKVAAALHLPSYDSFYRFFGEADHKANILAYKRFLRERLDPDTLAYWQGRDLTGRRRITLFSRDLYHHGLLGYTVGLGHLIARAYGIDLKELTRTTSLAEQRSFFERTVAPLFDKRLVRWVTKKRVSLYGLGIPPAQYEALATAGNGDMAVVLRARLERLACGFAMSENYFAWQAFGRGYASGESGPLPPYLDRANFAAIRARADRVRVLHRSVTDHLANEPSGSLDAYVLLDAQDWMSDAQLNALWAEMTRTARPGARVVFRTAAEPSPLPPGAGRGAGPLALRRRAQPRARRQGPRGDLRRLPPLCVSGSAMSSEALPARELMDRVYRHQRHVYDLTRKHYLLGRDHLIDRLRAPEGGEVLELGCGTGRNLIAAAKRYRRARFHGVDISGAMLATARRSIAAAGLDGRILLTQGDATRSDPAMLGRQRFDRVFFSYSLSMMPAWPQALAHGAGLLAPGGRLSLVDFGQQDGLPPWFRALLFAWLDKFYVRPAADLADTVARIAMVLGAPFSVVDLYRGYACYAEIRRRG